MKDRVNERSLWLSEDDAMGLLDVVMLCPDELTPAQKVAAIKLSEFCRQFLHEADEATLVHSNRPNPEKCVFVD